MLVPITYNGDFSRCKYTVLISDFSWFDCFLKELKKATAVSDV